MQTIRLTIAIPTLNRLELVRRALASALAQTIDVDIIVSDNGSSDGTDAYFRCADLPSNVRYFHLETTVPVQEHGIFLRSKVRTDWVVFLSDDDELEPTFAEECLRLIVAHPSVSLVYTGANFVYSGFSRPGRFGPRIESSASFLRNFLQGNRNICFCATAFRIADLRAIPPQPSDRFIGDMYYWVRILSGGGEVGCVGQLLAHYHAYRPQVSSETGRTTVLQWYEESEELALMMVSAILRQSGCAERGPDVEKAAACFVAKTTILQLMWNRLRNVRRGVLLAALFKLAPGVCVDPRTTAIFIVYGFGALVLPRRFLEQAMLLRLRLMV